MRRATKSSSTSRGSAWADRSSSPALLPATPSSQRLSYGTTNACSKASTCASASTWRSRPMPTPSSWPPAPGRTCPTCLTLRRDSRPRGSVLRGGRPDGRAGRGRRLGRRRLGARRRRAPGGERLRGRRSPSGRPPSARPCTQYQRNLYAARLYRAGIEIWHHLELASWDGRRASFTNVFAPELAPTIEADALVLALGRVPVRELDVQGAVEVGDRLSPRSLEEAILEGSLAGRAVG